MAAYKRRLAQTEVTSSSSGHCSQDVLSVLNATTPAAMVDPRSNLTDMRKAPVLKEVALKRACSRKAPEEESLIPESTAAPADGSSSKLSSSKASGASLFKPEEEKAEKPGNLLSHLSDFLYQKLRFGNDEEPVHILDEPTIDGIVRYIKSGKCKNIIAMIGAGISTAAGIPDFRSPNSGIYSKLGKFNLPSPEAIFEIGYFRRNPAPFYALARQLFPKNLKNIDCLERLAGIPAEAIVEAHGTFHTSHCLSCNCEYSLDWLRERIAAEAVPLCLNCNSPVKPDIVFFGERLPDRFFDLSEEDFARCDLLLIVGTSIAGAAIRRTCGQGAQLYSPSPD
ncbi:hypothetical protein MRX96_024858 [Rhipicephalus microplus]